MATKKKTGKSMGSKTAWEIGAGITAATIAAAAGAYLLSDKKTRTKAKKWAMAARKEVAKNAKVAKKLGQKEYGRIVEQAVKRYGSMEKMTGAEMLAAARELKGEWKQIQTHAKKMANAHRPTERHAAKQTGAKRKTAHAKKSRG
jgi:hypothetical protein